MWTGGSSVPDQTAVCSSSQSNMVERLSSDRQRSLMLTEKLGFIRREVEDKTLEVLGR